MNQHTKSKMTPDDGALDRSIAFETHATEIKNPCGCTLVRQMDYVQVYQCPMHAAAEEMLTALEAVVHAAQLRDSALGGVAATLADAAVRKARGQ